MNNGGVVSLVRSGSDLGVLATGVFRAFHDLSGGLVVQGRDGWEGGVYHLPATGGIVDLRGAAPDPNERQQALIGLEYIDGRTVAILAERLGPQEILGEETVQLLPLDGTAPTIVFSNPSEYFGYGRAAFNGETLLLHWGAEGGAGAATTALDGQIGRPAWAPAEGLRPYDAIDAAAGIEVWARRGHLRCRSSVNRRVRRRDQRGAVAS